MILQLPWSVELENAIPGMSRLNYNFSDLPAWDFQHTDLECSHLLIDETSVMNVNFKQLSTVVLKTSHTLRSSEYLCLKQVDYPT